MAIRGVCWAALAVGLVGGLAGCTPTYAASEAVPAYQAGAVAPRPITVAVRHRHHDRRAVRRPRPLFEEAPDQTEWFNPPSTAGE